MHDTMKAIKPRPAWLRLVTLLMLATLSALPAGPAAAACQPQCVAHARHSAKIFTHRVGARRGAIDWFRAASQDGATTDDPGAGEIRLPLVLLPQRGLHPRFGHVVFVKRATRRDDGRLDLSLSHTNFAGECRLEHATAIYDPAQRMLSFNDGFFSGRRFRTAGFILR